MPAVGAIYTCLSLLRLQSTTPWVKLKKGKQTSHPLYVLLHVNVSTVYWLCARIHSLSVFAYHQHVLTKHPGHFINFCWLTHINIYIHWSNSEFIFIHPSARTPWENPHEEGNYVHTSGWVMRLNFCAPFVKAQSDHFGKYMWLTGNNYNEERNKRNEMRNKR